MVRKKLEEESIYHVARRIEDVQARGEYLDQVCDGDDALHDRIKALLDADQEETGFLKSVDGHEQPTVDHATSNEQPGTSIGPYKLLHLLGEGGMGSVYLAEQQHPVKRRVAVKLIKQGLNSQQFTARFEAERQALAMMDHPNIAKVLDAGCSEDGRNYFVMEYVKGIPITEFCDENRLSAEERLKLFIKVCQAVQHAHQKGVIHRDLKPSNVMVAMYDDQPVPKVIDFGVAKATHQPLTEHTLCTVPGQIVGTWEYMSPEQAILNQLDVDTRTDIYSLGVVLYELLTGQTPLDLKSLKPEMLEERLRRIREQEPARPSNRVSSLGEAAAATAAYRNTEANSLSKKLRGDLDTIVMKALEKDRSQRYETANGFAAEIQRYLNDEPLSIRPPSSFDQVRRAWRRHRPIIAFGTTVFAVLAVGLGVAILAFISRNQMYQQAEQRRVQLDGFIQRLQSELLNNAINAAANGDEEVLEGMLVELTGESGTLSSVAGDVLRGVARYASGDLDGAVEILKIASHDAPNDYLAHAALTWASFAIGNDQLFESSVARLNSATRKENDDLESIFHAFINCFAEGDADDRSISALDEILGKHPSWSLGYVFRSEVYRDLFHRTKDPQDLQSALNDFHVAETLAPRSGLHPHIGFVLHLQAVQFGNSFPDKVSPFEMERWIKRCDKYLKYFQASFDKEAEGQGYALAYLREMGRTDLADEYEKQLEKNFSHIKQLKCSILFREGEYEKLNEFLSADPPYTSPAIRAMTMIAEGKDANKVLESDEFNALRFSRLTAGEYAIDAWLLAGEEGKAKSLAEEILEGDVAPLWEWEAIAARYHAGLMTESQLLERARPFHDATCVAHFSIGMQKLARGYKAEAREHFRLAVNTGRFWWWDHCWAKAFLKKMEADSDWPGWIETRDPDAQNSNAFLETDTSANDLHQCASNAFSWVKCNIVYAWENLISMPATLGFAHSQPLPRRW